MTPLLSAAINHLLAEEPWAREKLAAHAGKIACVDSGLISMRWKVTAEGLLQHAAPDEAASVTIRIKLADLPLIVQNRERAFSYVKIEGDADFANTISQLSRSLRWEAEDDLSKWVGDIAATRIVAGAKTALQSVRSTHQTLSENIAEYFLEEKPMLIRPDAAAEFAAAVIKLRDDLERLDKRVDRLKERR